MMPVPGAQCRGVHESRLALLAGDDPDTARDAELGLWGVLGGRSPLLAPGVALLTLDPRPLLLSACKPAERGDGMVVRVLNPTAAPHTAVLRAGFPVRAASPIRLDEEPSGAALTVEDGTVRFDVPPHALRSVLLL
jgi:alpha-mannosidase